MTDNPQKLLSLQEVAARLNVNDMTIRRMLKAGKLPSFRVGRLIRVKPEDLEAYLAKAAQAGNVAEK